MTDPVDIDFVREYANHKAERSKVSFELMSTQFISWSKWLNASLLAINGGGFVALRSLENITNTFAIVPIMYGLGIIFALLAGVFSQEYYGRIYPLVARKIDYWERVRLTGQRTIKIEKFFSKKIKSLETLGLFTVGFGWLSGIAFIVGSIMLFC